MIRRIALTLGMGVAVMTIGAGIAPSSTAAAITPSFTPTIGIQPVSHFGQHGPARSGYIVASS